MNSWLSKQTNAGFVLTIPVIRDLDEGQTRDFEFHILNPSQQATNVAFTVIGLDELSVPSGVTITYYRPAAEEMVGSVRGGRRQGANHLGRH